MNQGGPKCFARFKSLYNKYVHWLNRNKVQRDRFCIDHGAVLAVYGIRDCGDLDFIHDGYEKLLKQDSTHPFAIMDQDLNSHNGLYPRFYPLSKEEILYNPKNHFYYFEHKVLALPILLDIKKKLNRPKDISDLQLVEKHLKRYS